MNNSDDSKTGSVIPLEYSPAPRARRFGRTNCGYLALAVVLAMALPIVLVERIFPLMGWRSDRIEGNISVVFFDFGLFIGLTAMALATLGLLQDRRNRIAAITALGILLTTCVF